MPFNFWDWETQKVLEAKLTGKISKVPPFGKYAFAFTLKNKKEVHSWAYQQLKKEIMDAPFGTVFKIEYLGKGKDPETDYNIKLFKIEIVDWQEKVKKKSKEKQKDKEYEY